MSRPHVIYEQPLSERIRTFLRLEFLFNEAAHARRGESQWDARLAITSLLEILSLLGRNDLRQEIIKELERHTKMLSRLEGSEDVDQRRLSVLLQELERLADALHGNGALAQALRDNEFLSAVRQRSAIPGGTCEFDLPSLHFWLNRPPEQRDADIERWLQELDPVRKSLSMILNLIRNSNSPSEETADGGMFQKTLDKKLTCHLVRVLVSDDVACFPEISGSKHRFTVRFMELPNPDKRPVQTQQDVPFQLICCIF